MFTYSGHMRGGCDPRGAFGVAEWPQPRMVGRVAGIVGGVERCRSVRWQWPFSDGCGRAATRSTRSHARRVQVALRTERGPGPERNPMLDRLFRVIAATAVITMLSAPVATVAKAASSKPATTKKTTALDLRRKAVLDLYARQKDLQYRYLTNRTTTLLIPKEGSRVFTGIRLDFAVKDEARGQAAGSYLDMRPEQYESFDLRIASISTTTAVLRVCERTSGFHFRKVDNQRSDPNESAAPFITDLELTAVYSAKTKRWLISKAQYLESVEGESKCAAGS